MRGLQRGGGAKPHPTHRQGGRGARADRKRGLSRSRTVARALVCRAVPTSGGDPWCGSATRRPSASRDGHAVTSCPSARRLRRSRRVGWRDFCEIVASWQCWSGRCGHLLGISANRRRVGYPPPRAGRRNRGQARRAIPRNRKVTRHRCTELRAWIEDAPPRRHRTRRAGYGGIGGCRREAGARYARGGPRVCVKRGLGCGVGVVCARTWQERP